MENITSYYVHTAIKLNGKSFSSGDVAAISNTDSVQSLLNIKAIEPLDIYLATVKKEATKKIAELEAEVLATKQYLFTQTQKVTEQGETAIYELLKALDEEELARNAPAFAIIEAYEARKRREAESNQ